MFNRRTLSIVNIYSGNHKTGEKRRRRLIAIICELNIVIVKWVNTAPSLAVFHVHWTM